MSTSVPPPGFQPEHTPAVAAPEHPSAVAPGGTPAPALAPVGAPVAHRPRLARRSGLLTGGLLLVAAVAAAFALLGSSNSPGIDPIAQAASLSSTAPGYRMNLAMTIDGPALTSPLRLTGHAIVDLRDQAASMSFAMDLSGEQQAAQALGSTTMNLAMILDRGVVYLKLPAAVAQAAPGLGGKPWLRMDVSKVTGVPGVASLNDPTMSDPSRMLQYLRASSSSITNAGHQVVDGALTTHYHAVLDLGNIAANMPPSVQQALSQLEQTTGVQGIPVDVWIDAHHLVRRIGMALSLHPSGQAIQEAMTADLTDYGPQPRPTLPPDGQVQDLTNLIHIGG